VAYVAADAEQIEPGFGGALGRVRLQLGVSPFGIDQVDLPPGAPPREDWAPEQ
jgi:hypothetical protein